MVAWDDHLAWSARDEDSHFDGIGFYETWAGPSAEAAARLTLLRAIDSVLGILPGGRTEGETSAPVSVAAATASEPPSPSEPFAPEGLSAGSSPAQGLPYLDDAA